MVWVSVPKLPKPFEERLEFIASLIPSLRTEGEKGEQRAKYQSPLAKHNTLSRNQTLSLPCAAPAPAAGFGCGCGQGWTPEAT